MILNKRGLQCDMAEDGYEASKMIRENIRKYHIIFMDNMMPRIVSNHYLFAITLLTNFYCNNRMVLMQQE